MKKLFTLAILFTAGLIFSPNILFGQEMEPQKRDNAKWHTVMHVKYETGKMQKAKEMIHKYFMPATEKAGTDGPAMVLECMTGDWDLIVVWKMDGIEDMNWELSPDNIAWLGAMAEIAGGPEKAQEVWAEYEGMIEKSKVDIAQGW